MTSVPKPIAQLFSYFPLHTYPAEQLYPHREPITSPILWTLPNLEHGQDVLSSDVECLKWQAYLAFRGLNQQQNGGKRRIGLRTDVGKEGALAAEMPNLHVPGEDGGLLIAREHIAAWVDEHYGPEEDFGSELYDQNKAWTALLEGIVHESFLDSQEIPQFHLREWIPIPYSVGIYIPGLTLHSTPPVRRKPRKAEYAEAIGALSEKLGTGKWFLNTESPTPLDALLFAYLHLILDLSLKNGDRPDVRTEVTKRVNLVAWERRVRSFVRSAWLNSKE